MNVAVKDLYAIAGQRIGAGNPDFLADSPIRMRNADAVELLLLAGVDVAGIGGLPAVNIPLETTDGLPCGACLIGPAGSDKSLIDLAKELYKGME